MRVKILFNCDKLQDAIITKIILHMNIDVIVESAAFESGNGWCVLIIPDDVYNQFLQQISDNPSIKIEAYTDSIYHNHDECVECGLCISLCQRKVFSFDNNWHLVVNLNKCILCNICTQYCPQRALTIRNDSRTL